MHYVILGIKLFFGDMRLICTYRCLGVIAIHLTSSLLNSLQLQDSISLAEDRDKWRKYVNGVANPRIEDGYIQVLCNITGSGFETVNTSVVTSLIHQLKSSTSIFIIV